MEKGDLVTMDPAEWFDIDIWGVGVVVKSSPITERQRKYCAVYWVKLEAITWELSDVLRYVDESW